MPASEQLLTCKLQVRSNLRFLHRAAACLFLSLRITRLSCSPGTVPGSGPPRRPGDTSPPPSPCPPGSSFTVRLAVFWARLGWMLSSAELGWAALGWTGQGWAGLSWAGLAATARSSRSSLSILALNSAGGPGSAVGRSCRTVTVRSEGSSCVGRAGEEDSEGRRVWRYGSGTGAGAGSSRGGGWIQAPRARLSCDGRAGCTASRPVLPGMLRSVGVLSSGGGEAELGLGKRSALWQFRGATWPRAAYDWPEVGLKTLQTTKTV